MELKLIFAENNSEKARTTLGSGEYVIGRDSKCEVVVASDSVSRRHARVTVTESSVFLEDLGSANGTFIDGHRAEGRMQLSPGQRVEMGHVVLNIRWTPPRAGARTLRDDTSSPAEQLPEELLRGHKYEVGDIVATGGMGVIRQARDLRVRRAVAMKLMGDTTVVTPAVRRRFLDEAQVTGQLEHPNVVPVYDLGVDDDGQPFYTMKFVRGITLKVVLDDILNLKADTIAQFPLGRLLTILQKACDAIAFAHSKGILHRDLKPENIMIGDFGEVMVMDWGLAKRIGKMDEWTDESIPSPTHPSFQTSAGVVMGTPHFMAPEQANGRINELDVRTDIFALGGVLYNILTLQPPFPGETALESLAKIRAGTITPPGRVGAPLQHCPGRRIPDSLAAVAMKALAMRPEDRYQTVRELQKDIEAYQGGFATSAERAGILKQLVLAVNRRKFEFMLATGATVALLGVGGVSIARIVSSERHARESLAALRAAAPAYASQAVSLIEDRKFSEALDKVAAALALTPDQPDLYVLKGNILESQLRLVEAGDAYAQALKLDATNAAAKQNFELCQKLLQDNAGRDELSPASLHELQAAMLRQQRSAEALAMVRRLGKDVQALYDTWKIVLEREGLIEPVKNTSRLIVDDTGLFTLNLNRMKVDSIAALKGMPLRELHLMFTEVRDLSPLRDLPITTLNLAVTPVSDLEPLRGMPLKILVLAGCKNVSDLSPVCECRQLETLLLPPEPGNLDCLRQLPNLARISNPQRLSLAKEEIGRRIGRAFPGLLDETVSADEFWKQQGTHSGK